MLREIRTNIHVGFMQIKGQIYINFVFKMPLTMLHLLLRHMHCFSEFLNMSKKCRSKYLGYLVCMHLSQTQKPDLQLLYFMAPEAVSVRGGTELVGIWLSPVFGPLCWAQLCKQTYFFEVCDWNPALNSLKHVRTKKKKAQLYERCAWHYYGVMGGGDQWFRLSLAELSCIRQKL